LGGSILVPVLRLTHSSLSPEIITAISIALAPCNAISESVAYSRSGRPYWLQNRYCVCTIRYSRFNTRSVDYAVYSAVCIQNVFGLLLILLSALLFFKKRKLKQTIFQPGDAPRGWKNHTVIDKNREAYSYTYNQMNGIIISVVVGIYHLFLVLAVALYMCLLLYSCCIFL
jgi:uncharacterized membrane protein YfcA